MVYAKYYASIDLHAYNTRKEEPWSVFQVQTVSFLYLFASLVFIHQSAAEAFNPKT